MISPYEAFDSLVHRIDRAITQGEDLSLWKNAALSVPMMVVQIGDTDQLKWKRVQERENVGKLFKHLFRTPFGRAFEIIDMIAGMGGDPSPQEAADEWNAKIESSGLGDPVTTDLVLVAMKVKNRIFKDTGAMAQLVWAENNFNPKTNPWDTLYKLDAVATKLRPRDLPDTKEKLLWMIGWIHDKHIAGSVEKGGMAIKGLSG